MRVAKKQRNSRGTWTVTITATDEELPMLRDALEAAATTVPRETVAKAVEELLAVDDPKIRTLRTVVNEAAGGYFALDGGPLMETINDILGIDRFVTYRRVKRARGKR